MRFLGWHSIVQNTLNLFFQIRSKQFRFHLKNQEPFKELQKQNRRYCIKGSIWIHIKAPSSRQKINISNNALIHQSVRTRAHTHTHSCMCGSASSHPMRICQNMRFMCSSKRWALNPIREIWSSSVSFLSPTKTSPPLRCQKTSILPY